MSTRSIARSAIEGGRTGYSKHARRHSHSELRAATRGFLRSDDPDARTAPGLRYISREFNDRLGGPMNWMRAHVGRHWNDVYSELRSKFDVRTTPGRHIVFDHMVDEQRFPAFYRFHLDANGILRERPRERYLYDYRVWERIARPVTAAQVTTWAAGRRPGLVGTVWFWYVRASEYGKRARCTAWNKDLCLHLHESDIKGDIWYYRSAMRQDRRLTVEDIDFLEKRMSGDQRKRLGAVTT